MTGKRRRRTRALWHLPDRFLKAHGDFLGGDDGTLIKFLSIMRSAFGLAILVGIALTYPGFTKSTPELIATGANVPASAAAISKLANSWLTSILYGLLLSLVAIVLFAVVVVVFAKRDQRLTMVRLMCIPLIAFVLFAGLMAAIVGAVDLLSVVTNWFDQQRIHDSAASVGLGLAEIVALIVLFVGMVPILAVLYIKSIYLAAVDVFRADDAHPLLAPFATTVAAWSLAGIGYFTGGPTGVSYDLGLWILFLGPTTVSILNAVDCCLLWRNHHDLMFRGGPLTRGQRGPRKTASWPQYASIFATVMIIGPVTLGVFYLGDRIFVPPKVSGPVSLRWSYATRSYASSPAVAGGTAYFGSDDGTVYAVNAATGHLLWSHATGSDVYAGPAVAGGTVYVGSDDDKLSALNAANGHLRWSYSNNYAVESTPVVAGGTVYFGSNDHRVYALNAATGLLRWSYSAQDAVLSSPVAAGGSVYFGSNDGRVYALNAANGRLRWSYTTGNDVFSSPAVADGTVYVGSEDDKVYALNAVTGRLRWSYTTGGQVFSSPAVADGTVYIGSDDDKVYALNAANGQLRWSYTTGDYVNSSPVVADGIVYIGSNDNRVYAFDGATGRRLWYYTTGDSVISKPAVDGSIVYAGSSDFKLYALNTAG
jgi:outer membrane protein assembly factor BamB